METINALYAKSFPGENAYNPQRKISAFVADPDFVFPMIEQATLHAGGSVGYYHALLDSAELT